jgi:hypothetical protein
VVTDQKATGAKILAAVAKVRIEKGLTCGIAGYPASGCGDPVKSIKVPATDTPIKLQIGAPVGSATTPTPAAAATTQTPALTTDSGTPWGGIVIAAVVVVALAGGGFTLSRRRAAGQKN